MFAIFLSDKMDPFYQNIASFPTVFFTFFLAVCLVYWLIAVLGIVDLDILDLDLPESDADINSNSGANAGCRTAIKAGSQWCSTNSNNFFPIIVWLVNLLFYRTFQLSIDTQRVIGIRC